MTKKPLCIVTGFSRGLGKSCFEILNHTNQFHMIGISKTQGYRCNMSNPKEITSIVEQLRKEFPDQMLQYVVHCAAIHDDALLIRQSNDSIINQIQTNVIGSIIFAREISKWMIRQKVSNSDKDKLQIIENKTISEQIDNSSIQSTDRAFTLLTSIVGIDGNEGQSVYSSSKASLIGLVKSLSKEIGPRGIRVNCVAPGWIGGEGMANKWGEQQNEEKLKNIIENIPLRRVGELTDVANLVRFLSSQESKYITGQVIRLDGGLTL